MSWDTFATRRTSKPASQDLGTGSSGTFGAGLVEYMPTETGPEATASGLLYARIGERAGANDTYVELAEQQRGSLLRFAMKLIAELVDQQVQLRTKTLEEENARLRAQLRDIEERRVVEFRLPARYWEEEAEES